MKKITIEINGTDGIDIHGPGISIAQELRTLALVMDMRAYREDENAMRNRIAWYKSDDSELIVTVKIS